MNGCLLINSDLLLCCLQNKHAWKRAAPLRSVSMQGSDKSNAYHIAILGKSTQNGIEQEGQFFVDLT